MSSSTTLVKPAPFTLKLLEMMKRPENITSNQKYPLLSWSDDGKSIILREPKVFGQRLLPLYFKHTNYLSFIRQLNGHGFRKNEDVPIPNDHFPYKITTQDSVDSQILVYTNQYFQRDNPENFYLVQREHSKNYKRLVEEGLIKVDDPLLSVKNTVKKRKHVTSNLHYKPEYVDSNIQTYNNYKTQIQQSQAEIKIVLDKVKEENSRLQREQDLLNDSLDSTTHSMRYLCWMLIQMVKQGDRSPELLGQVEEIKRELCKDLDNGSWICNPEDKECIELKQQVKEECNTCDDSKKENENSAKPVEVHVQSPNSSIPSPPIHPVKQISTLSEKITEVDDKQIDDLLSTDQLGMLTTVIGNNENCRCPCEAVKRLKMENTLEVDNFNEWEKRFQIPDFDPLEKFEEIKF